MKMTRLLLTITLIYLCSCADKVNLYRLSGATSLASGVLDSSFGVAGAIQIDNPASYGAVSRDDTFNSITQDSSGNIFAAGRSDDNGFGEFNMLLMKFSSDGIVDTSFGGGDGVVDIDVGQPDDDGARDVALLSTGEIVLVGELGGVGTTRFSFSKWNSAGTVETRATFQGVADSIDSCDTGLGQNDSANALAINSTDQVYITGRCGDTATDFNLLVTRTNSSGVVDAGFSAAVTAGWFNYGTDTDGTNEEGNDVFLDSSGNPVIVGTRISGTTSTILLIKLQANGTLDTTWGGGDGIVDDATNGQSSRGIIDSSGRIYLVGRSHTGVDWDMSIWRFTAAGVLDPTWGTGGELDFDPGAGLKARGEDIKIDSSGNIVVFGFIEDSITFRDDTAIWRYTSSGALDTSFASGAGYITNSLSSANNDRGQGGLINAATGKLIVGGTVRQDAADNQCGSANPCDLNLLRFE